jgi:hypothetical protein
MPFWSSAWRCGSVMALQGSATNALMFSGSRTGATPLDGAVLEVAVVDAGVVVTGAGLVGAAPPPLLHAASSATASAVVTAATGRSHDGMSADVVFGKPRHLVPRQGTASSRCVLCGLNRSLVLAGCSSSGG